VKLSEVSIRRPVFAVVMSVVIILFGLVAFTRLPVREYPDVDPPIVSIVTLYRGASPSVIETEITEVLEEQLATLEGVKSMTSASQEQGSVITVEFELQRGIEAAANDVRDRVSRVRGQLPAEADDPIVQKVDTNAQPIFWLALFSDRYSGLELTEVADLTLKEKLQRLPGVGSVFLGAERKYAMRVWIDPQALTARGLTVGDVETAIRAGNAEIPGGRVEGNEREFAVRTHGELRTPEEFAAIIVRQQGDDVVRLGDVARVEVGAKDERTVARFDGKAAMGLGVVKQSEASTLEVAKAVRDALPALRAELPEGMQLEVAYDSSTFIQQSIEEVGQTLLIAVALVVLVILVFLRSLRATLIPALAIPTSIIGTFTVAWILGYSVNILTLLALVLAIGIVVDDAIVMLENVWRHLEMGKPRLRAALDGAREIGFAIVATTIALVAVFVPVAFLTGSVGRLFKEFAACVAVSVLISGFVALTLTPMLCSRLLKPPDHAAQGLFMVTTERFFRGIERGYERLLGVALRWKALVLLIAAALVGLAVLAYVVMPRELVPTEDRGLAFGFVIAPEGATLGYTDKHMQQVEQILLPLPERAALFTATGLGFNGPGRVTDGFVFLNLKPRAERKRSQQQIVQALFPPIYSIPGVTAFLINPPSLGGGFNSSAVGYVLQADTYEDLASAVGTFLQEAGKLPYLLNLQTDLKLNKPQLDIAIDRDRAASLGVSVTDIGTTLETCLGGRVVSDFKRGSKQYDVIVQLDAKERSTPAAIEELTVRGAAGLVRLSNVVTVSESVAPKELNHFNRVRAATMSASLAPGVDLGHALADLDTIWRTKLPPDIKREFSGQSLEFVESSGKLYLLFIIAVVFIFLTLAAQFESFIHPLTILLSVPLAVVGALFSLLVLKQSLNIYSQVGLIMLVGLVTKNAILIVEYANQLRARGNSLHEAVTAACRIRLRPILMTSFATVFGVLPIAVGLGAGGEARRPLGIAVVGGLLFSTFLTLVLVPIAWLLLARFTHARPTEAVDREISSLDAESG
jgi:multidrug efflux pump